MFMGIRVLDFLKMSQQLLVITNNPNTIPVL